MRRKKECTAIRLITDTLVKERRLWDCSIQDISTTFRVPARKMNIYTTRRAILKSSGRPVWIVVLFRIIPDTVIWRKTFLFLIALKIEYIQYI